MGAKQSKRSVDISGKEAEGAGEVAAAGAGGEGRVEQLADADALKPQLNGDAHIHEEPEKQKDLDSGTPENEKDATTEKEAKVQEEEKETEPLTNGESEQKVENGESTPTPEDGKKPKKEKVKKKWSLRSISFSRKDKPKQEKKQKDEEPKTNGEPEKVPEETAEVVPEPAVTETAEEANTESKDEKTPETPVTEPITNGSTTPVSPKDESPVVEEPPTPSANIDSPELQPEIETEQLPVNGLSLEETSKETPENEKNEESKEEPTADTTETVPEISVKKEVCVEQMPLIESTPPPLPANPPPSSVASFAATTMAPEPTDASLANTADNANLSNSDPIAKIVEPSPSLPENELTLTQTVSSEMPSDTGKEDSEKISFSLTQSELDNETKKPLVISLEDKNMSSEVEIIKNDSVTIEKSTIPQNEEGDLSTDIEIPAIPSEPIEQPEDKTDVQNVIEDFPIPPPICDYVKVASTEKINVEGNFDNTQATINELNEISVISNHISDNEKQPAEEIETITESGDATGNKKAKSKDSLGNLIETIECNGNIDEENVTIERKTSELIPPINSEEIKNIESGRSVPTSDDSMPPSLSEANESGLAAGMASNEESESFPLPPSELCRSELEPSPPPSLPEPASPEPDTPAHAPQESLPVSDKLAELIPEIPDVPELNTETLQKTTSDVAVTN